MALELESATMRKVALRFLPLLGLCYTINVLDRFNVSIAALTITNPPSCNNVSTQCWTGGAARD
jgi:hypothetical protein